MILEAELEASQQERELCLVEGEAGPQASGVETGAEVGLCEEGEPGLEQHSCQSDVVDAVQASWSDEDGMTEAELEGAPTQLNCVSVPQALFEEVEEAYVAGEEETYVATQANRSTHAALPWTGARECVLETPAVSEASSARRSTPIGQSRSTPTGHHCVAPHSEGGSADAPDAEVIMATPTARGRGEEAEEERAGGSSRSGHEPRSRLSDDDPTQTPSHMQSETQPPSWPCPCPHNAATAPATEGFGHLNDTRQASHLKRMFDAGAAPEPAPKPHIDLVQDRIRSHAKPNVETDLNPEHNPGCHPGNNLDPVPDSGPEPKPALALASHNNHEPAAGFHAVLQLASGGESSVSRTANAANERSFGCAAGCTLRHPLHLPRCIRLPSAVGESITLGRAESNDVQLDSLLYPTMVSRSHARIIVCEGGGWELEDMGASNGTFVNGRSVDGRGGTNAPNKRRRIAIGDVLSLGNVRGRNRTDVCYHVVGSSHRQIESTSTPSGVVPIPAAVSAERPVAQPNSQ